MANIKTSNEASGAPISKTDLFRIARSGDNYKLTTEEIFTETLNRSTLVNKMNSSQLIPGRIYKVTVPTATTLTDLMFVQAVSNTQIDSNVAIQVNGNIYPAYYDFANDTFGYIDTTYNALRTDMLSGKLVPGMTYRISDYVSKNFLNGVSCAFSASGTGDPSYTPWGPGSGNPNYNAFQVYTSSVEPLYVKALTIDRLEIEARSEIYPSHIIHYNAHFNKLALKGIDTGPVVWDSVNNYAYIDLTGNPILYGYGMYLSISISTGELFYIEVSSLVPGFNKSSANLDPTVISEKTSDIEVVNNGNKIIILNLTSTQVSNITSVNLNASFSNNSYADMPGLILKRIDPIFGVRCDFDYVNRKYRRFEVDLENIPPTLNPVFAGLPPAYIGISDNFNLAGTTGNYADFSTFYVTPFNVSIECGYQYGTDTIDNIVFKSYAENVYINSYLVRDSTFVQSVNGLELSEYPENNTFLRDIYACKIGGYNNIINAMLVNSEMQFFNNNLINVFYWTNNIIKSEFYGNRIHEFPTGGPGINFSDNIIDCSNFNSNKIYGEFSNNTIRNNMTNNTMETFTNNTVKTSISSQNFLSATHVAANYDCDIVMDSTNNSVLVYTNGTAYQFVSPTS